MFRQLWGEFEEDDEKCDEGEKMVSVSAKRAKLEEVQSRSPTAGDKKVTVKVKNPLVTQTIEVMKQTEMLQSLIDTYSNKSGSSNYLLNPCQMIPEVDFPPENVAEFTAPDERFAKPFWFVPPSDTRFARGVPQHYPEISAEVCRASLRKAVCGQLRMAGFTDTAESALVLFADAIEEFVRSLMQQVREVHANEDPPRDTEREIEVAGLERAYYALTNTSLTQVHNYFKHHLIARNRSEIAEFNGVLQEYDKLMKESQSMQKQEDGFQEGDFLNILEMPPTQANEALMGSGGGMDMGGATLLGLLDGSQHMSTVQHTGAIKSETSLHEQNLTADGMNPYATESLLHT